MQAELPDATTTLVRIPSRFNKMLWVRAGACQALPSLPTAQHRQPCYGAGQRQSALTSLTHGALTRACASCDGPLLWSSQSSALPVSGGHAVPLVRARW